MPHTYQPFAETPEINQLGADLRMNMPDVERLASAVAGAAVLSLAPSRQGPLRWLFLLAGAALLRRGWTGRCPWYAHTGLDRRHDSSGVPGNRGVKAEHSVEIHRSPEVLFAFWRDLEHLPKVMRNVESVRQLSDRRSRWQVKTLAGQTVEWDAEVINEEPGKMIAWQTLPGAAISNSGSVWFEPTEAGGTQLKVALQYDPPAGAVGAAVAKLLGASPQQSLEEDLGRFKEFAERELAPFGA